MSQGQSPSITQVTNYFELATTKLELATTKLDEATEEFEQANKLRQALDQVGVLNPLKLKLAQEDILKSAKEKQKKAVNKVAKVQKMVLTACKTTPPNEQEAQKLAEIRDRAVAVLTKLPPPVFDRKKMCWVIGFLVLVLVATGSAIYFSPSGKVTVIIGLVVAVIGQLCESVKKADDAKKYPRFLDGLVLSGEAIKILGALTVLAGAVL